jgi:hypothetical protein
MSKEGRGGVAPRVCWWTCVATTTLLSSCSDADDPSDSGDAAIVLHNENNYRSSASLSLPAVETASAVDLDICWDEVRSDLLCHDLEPQVDLDNVALLRFLHLSERDVEQRLTAGELPQSEVAGYLAYPTDHESTCTTLSAMSFLGTEIEVEEEYTESSDHTYMLLLAEGTIPGVGAKAMMFLRPTQDSSNTRVEAQPGCGLLDFSADLASAEPVAVPTRGPWVVDWRNITRDGQANDIVFARIDTALIGFYEGMTTADLEEQIMDLELVATEMWEIELAGGRKADLSTAESRQDGAAFWGFERNSDGLWLFGLLCSTCQNPAPVVLSVLEPSFGGV